METSPLKCNVYLINTSSKITQNYKHSEDKGHILSGSFSLVRGAIIVVWSVFVLMSWQHLDCSH